MNCCNANGNCNQGRDCPARYTSTPALDQAMDEYAKAMERAGRDYFSMWDAAGAAVLVAVVWFLLFVAFL